jgi:hypothetical protein
MSSLPFREGWVFFAFAPLTVANRDIKDKTPNHQICPTITTYIVATCIIISSIINFILSVGYINSMLHFYKLRITGKDVNVIKQYFELNISGRFEKLCGEKI